MKAVKTIALLLLLFVTFTVRIFHAGVFRHPDVAENVKPRPGRWIDRTEFGIHQLILEGAPYERGLESGRLTAHLLRMQEEELTAKLFHIVPPWIFIPAEAFGIRWFVGIDKFLDPAALQEMYGVSKSAPKEFDYLADGYTRQIAYHGLHEVGQMMVDQKSDLMGCTVVASPSEGSWVVGRTFDFEGGRTFDREKIMKWVFPDRGHAFVSVIWAGMVGAVTGVNDQGIYVSLNAAGSRDFRRIGTPSTLIVHKILQESASAEDALNVLQHETLFITDIFVILDSKHGKMFRVEKSPRRIEILPMTEPTVVANHLVGKAFDDDPTNVFRRDDLTSAARVKRGTELLPSLKGLRGHALEARTLEILRDKGAIDGKPLHLGNRSAIDPLIAAHAVIFNGKTQTFYVSQGPAVSGPFLGFDLAASFAKREPVRLGMLPADPLVSPESFEAVKSSFDALAEARHQLKRKKCDLAANWVTKASELYPESYEYHATRGDLEACRGNTGKAREAWSQALGLHPAYRFEREALERKLR